jgi:hypothetical protein
MNTTEPTTTCRICEERHLERHACPLAQDYDVIDGRICSPGKFQGEARYMPHFYGVYLDGFADEQRGGILSVEVSAEDKLLYPELRRRKRVRWYERDDGFICQI